MEPIQGQQIIIQFSLNEKDHILYYYNTMNKEEGNEQKMLKKKTSIYFHCSV